MERGIIIGAEVEINIATNQINIIRSSPNPYLLRHAVLYWDKIAFPQNNIIRYNIPDIDFLTQEGIAEQPLISNGSGDAATLYFQAQLKALELLTKREPDKWTIGQYAKAFICPALSKLSEAQFIEFEINNVLPVPPYDTHLDDLLNLKAKRKDEFNTLRIAIDELYDDALKWESLPRGKNASINKLEKAILDIQKISDVSWLESGSSFKLEFNIPNIIGGFLKGKEFIEYIGMPDLKYLGGLIGAATAPIKFEKKCGKVIFPNSLKSFAAIYSVEKEFPGSIKRDDSHNN